MMDLHSMVEFSRCYCIGICAFLVPTNLLLAISIILLVAVDQPKRLIYSIIGIAVFPAIALFLHVATWWAIGVVMLPTFILPLLASTCLAIYTYAVINPQHMRNRLMAISKFSVAKYQQLVTN
jgi:hypothetical protein